MIVDRPFQNSLQHTIAMCTYNLYTLCRVSFSRYADKMCAQFARIAAVRSAAIVRSVGKTHFNFGKLRDTTADTI